MSQPCNGIPAGTTIDLVFSGDEKEQICPDILWGGNAKVPADSPERDVKTPQSRKGKPKGLIQVLRFSCSVDLN